MKKNIAIHSVAIFATAIALTTSAFAQITIPTSTSDGYLLIDPQSRWTDTATDTGRNSSNTFQGDPTTLTWGFVADGDNVDDGPDVDGDVEISNLIAMLDSAIGPGPGGSDLTQRPWYSLFESAYNRWSEVSGLTFVYESNDDGAGFPNSSGIIGTRADMRIGGYNYDGAFGVLAYNYSPNSGDMIIDTDDGSNYGQAANNYRYLRQVVMHEVGHGLGLNHWESNNSNALLEPFLNTSFDGPQHSDILAIQRAYGDQYEKGSGNNAFGNATSLGDVSLFNGIGYDADNSSVALTDVDFVSIDGSSDIDF